MDNLSITLTLTLSVSQSDKHKMKPQTSLFSGPLHIYMRRFICPTKRKKFIRRGIRINKHTRTHRPRTEQKKHGTKIRGILTAIHCCNSNDMKSSYQFHVISLTARILAGDAQRYAMHTMRVCRRTCILAIWVREHTSKLIQLNQPVQFAAEI